MRAALLLVASVGWVYAGVANAEPLDWGIPEHRLVVVDGEGSRPPADEGLTPFEESWPKLHLERGRDFGDAFLGPELYPEISSGLLITGERVDSTGADEFTAWIDLQLYALELRIPAASRLEESSPGRPHVHASLKIPLAVPGHESHRFALLFGAVVMDHTPTISDSSNAQVVYGFGGHGLSLQGRVGYGYDQYAPSQPLRLGLLFGALAALRIGPLQPTLELDGLRTDSTGSQRLTLVPALRIFPGTDETLQLGFGGLLTFVRGEDTPGRRYGALFNLTCNFM